MAKEIDQIIVLRLTRREDGSVCIDGDAMGRDRNYERQAKRLKEVCSRAVQCALGSRELIEREMDHWFDALLNDREQILRAFVAKYGVGPEDVEQVQEQHRDGRTTWTVRLKGAGQ